jgi:hypothetical protein
MDNQDRFAHCRGLKQAQNEIERKANSVVYMVAKRWPNDQGDAKKQDCYRADQQFFRVAVHRSTI